MRCPQFPHTVFPRDCLLVSVRQSVFLKTDDALQVRKVRARLPKNGGLRENCQAYGAADGNGLVRLNGRYPRSSWVSVLIGGRCIAVPRWRSLPHADLRGKE